MNVLATNKFGFESKNLCSLKFEFGEEKFMIKGSLF